MIWTRNDRKDNLPELNFKLQHNLVLSNAIASPDLMQDRWFVLFQ